MGGSGGYPGFKRMVLLILLFVIAVVVIFYSKSAKMIRLNTVSEERDNAINLESVSFETLSHLSQNDTRILNYIRKHHLFPPTTGGYNFDKYPKRAGNDPIAPYVAKLLNEKKNGFYVECGGNDGEFISNTLTLEINYGWTGLLIEADPQPFKTLLSRNRKAWAADVCLAMKPHPHTVNMVRHNNWSPISQVVTDNKTILPGAKFSPSCFPLYSILSALNVTMVDYLGLDIEKVELEVLKTFPFKDGGIKIRVISAEVERAVPHTKDAKIDEEKVKPLVELLESNGYKRMRYITADQWTHDLVFMRKDAIA